MNLDLLVDLHIHQLRQGPGSDAATRRAIDLAGLEGGKSYEIADMGCGTGASSLILAQELNANIQAVDFLAPFIARLKERAGALGLQDKINPIAAAMEEVNFAENSLDVIWSEGAIYNLGFKAGIQAWKKFLKPGGILAVSEITWLSAKRPDALNDFWHNAYPEINVASGKISILEEEGFSLLGYFPLADDCWMENYYTPLRQGFAGFLERNGQSEEARAIVAGEEAEIALYENNREFVSYGFYIARKMG
jgi:ubiquinone/menaquinone biosynthesis C-methylase UbiE